MPNLNKSYQWAIETCNKDNIGYSQPYRNQKVVKGITYYDCSSFIWYSLLAGGFDVKKAYKSATGETYSGNAITTANEASWLTALGFTNVDITSEWKKGDVLLRKGHTEMVYSGGTGKGVTMGAHSSNVALDKQVSINTYESSSSSWQTLWRYGDGGASDTGSSIYVISAICGNFWQESTLNPGLWENRTEGTWTDLGKGFGLGQWTNTGGDTHGRLYQLHEYLSNNGYSDDDGNGQLSYLIKENTWYSQQEASSFSNLTEFLTSDSTDIEMLTHAYNIGWEGIHDSSWDARVEYANMCYEYILAHYDDTNITNWIANNNYLSTADRLNNAVMVYRWLSNYISPIKPEYQKSGMPVWMMVRKV